jgi:hypothetical protein
LKWSKKKGHKINTSHDKYITILIKIRLIWDISLNLVSKSCDWNNPIKILKEIIKLFFIKKTRVSFSNS